MEANGVLLTYYDIYMQALKRYINSIVKDSDATDDIYQDAFIVIINKYNKAMPPAEYKALFMRVSWFTSMNYLRARQLSLEGDIPAETKETKVNDQIEKLRALLTEEENQTLDVILLQRQKDPISDVAFRSRKFRLLKKLRRLCNEHGME